MIKANEVRRLYDLTSLIKDADKRLVDLKAEKADLHAQLVGQVLAKQRVESACLFLLTAEESEETFSPPYKQCAIALAGESKVNKWVTTNHPHKKVHKLKLTAKAGKLAALRMSPRIAAVLDALTRFAKAA